MLIEDQMKFHELQALWWMNSAVTKSCLSKKIYHGTQGTEFTDDEKINHAMEIAQRHIHSFEGLAEKKHENEYKASRQPLIPR
jgi:hypothetical protein